MAKINRREFLGAVTAGVGLLACESTNPGVQGIDDVAISARPRVPPLGVANGWQTLGLGAERDGLIYAPSTYDRNVPAPLAVLLHGAGGSAADTWQAGAAGELADAKGILLLCPDSRSTTWDRLQFGEYGADVEFLNRALDLAFDVCNVDPSRICLGGFSDGAGYALSVGVGNGDLFSSLIAFSPGFFSPAGRIGKPRVFVSHGTGDTVLPWGYTAGTIVPGLEREGYDVEFVSYPSGHTVPSIIGEQAFAWFADG